MPPAAPAILTIFGITGDLAHRKLLPALYDLAQDNVLPKVCHIVGVTRTGTTPAEVVKRIESAVEAQGRQCDRAILERLEQAISIITMDITSETEYRRLKQALDQIENEHGECMQRLFYLAVPAQTFGPIVRLLGVSGLNAGCQHKRAESRLLIEKPLGYDLESAKELFEKIAGSFTDKQLYLIDHYLAKPGVEQLLDFRFNGGRFESRWDKKHIDHMVIRADEAIGIEGRAVFYEEVGALRDVVQSHLVQLLSLVTMERPADRGAAALHQAKQQIMKTIQPPAEDAMSRLTVRGQYQRYSKEVNNPDSTVETFTAAVFQLDSKRWQGVPFLLRTGKSLAAKRTAIEVVFKPDKVPPAEGRLTFNIEPEASIRFGASDSSKIIAKAQASSLDGYEQVIAAAMRGDKRLFASKEEVLDGWKAVTPILVAWASNQVPLDRYPVGSQGPRRASQLLQKFN